MKDIGLARAARVLLLAFGAAASVAPPPAYGVAVEVKAAQFYEDAQARFDRKDYAGAIVQLKNILKQDSKMLAAHVLLGRALLKNGEAAAAEAAFNQALQLGVDRSEVAAHLAQAYFDQGKYEQLLERMSAAGLPPRAKLELLVVRGNAQSELANFRAAVKSFDEARAIDPRFLPLLLADATSALQQGDRMRAAALAEQAIAVAPGDARTWNIKASVAHASGDVQAALDGYGKALAMAPDLFDARVARASLLLEAGRLDDAAKDIDQLQGEVPREPRAAYLMAVYASHRGDSATVQRALAEITKLIDPVPREIVARRDQLLLLGGLAHYGLNQPEKARDYIEGYIKRHPGHAGARKVLGSIYLSGGNTTMALSVLEPAQRSAPNDPQVLSLMASAYMAQKRYQKAASLLEEAMKLGAGTDARADLGMSLIGAGDMSGFEQLQQAYRKEPGQPRTGVALATLYLQRGQPKRAGEIADAVIKREPGNLVAANLLGVAKVAAGDRAGGRAQYERVVAQDPDFLPARLNLAKLDLADGKPDAARLRLLDILKKQPNNADAMFELARLEEGAGRIDESIRWLEKLLAIERRHVAGAEYLADIYIRRKQGEKALAVAKDITRSLPENLPALATQARAQMAMADLSGARLTLSEMTRIAGFKPDMQYRIALLQLSARNTGSALYSLDKALSGMPDHLPSQVLMTEVQAQTGEIAKAEQRARELLTRHPDRAIGHRLLADIAFARKQYAAAIAGYRTALAKEDELDGALRLFRAYLISGETAKGVAFMEAWSRKHPDDAAGQRALAEGYIRSGNLGAARATYEGVLKKQGDDPGVLNNLANVLLRQGDAAAVGYAERAVKLAPGDPSCNATLGSILVGRGEMDRGLRHLREARLREPGNRDIRYSLAAALAKAGRRDEARLELDQALKSEGAFDALEDARKLLRELSR
jgi:putative PEP-CTERM system TPR-repeat lipoprotein